MSAVRDDRADVATGYASDLRRTLPLLRDRRLHDAHAQRMRAAARNAIRGVLTYSTDRDELDLAIGALEELEQARHRRRLRRDVRDLQGLGATIPPRAVSELVAARTTESVKAHLADLDAARQRAGLPGLPA